MKGKEIHELFLKDLRSEWKQKHVILGVFLYLVSTILVLYYSIIRADGTFWNGLLWVIIVFLAINTISGSFVREIRHRQWYFYTLAHPLSFYLAKVLYNLILLLFLNSLAVILLCLFFGAPTLNVFLLILLLILASSGISLIFTFVSLISAKAGDQGAIMAILSMPVIFPLLMSAGRLGLVVLGLIVDDTYYKDIASLAAINMMTLALSLFLFPILWRD